MQSLPLAAVREASGSLYSIQLTFTSLVHLLRCIRNI